MTRADKLTDISPQSLTCGTSPNEVHMWNTDISVYQYYMKVHTIGITMLSKTWEYRWNLFAYTLSSSTENPMLEKKKYNMQLFNLNET